jgi:hypothetical protein
MDRLIHWQGSHLVIGEDYNRQILGILIFTEDY